MAHPTTPATREFASYLGGRVVDDGAVVMDEYTIASATADFTTADIGQLIYALGDYLGPGTYITGIISATEVEVE